VWLDWTNKERTTVTRYNRKQNKKKGDGNSRQIFVKKRKQNRK
jgi:hypothetical protein